MVNSVANFDGSLVESGKEAGKTVCVCGCVFLLVVWRSAEFFLLFFLEGYLLVICNF